MLLLMLAAAAAAWSFAVCAVAWEALRPRRRTLAWALAQGSPADPLEVGLGPERWALRTLRAADGVELPWWDLAGFEPGGPVVVIVHGWGRSRWDSLRRVQAILPVASRVLLPDLRGHGEAGGTTRLGEAEAADLIRLLDEVDHGVASTQSEGAGSEGRPVMRTSRAIVMIGHSMGAVVAVRAALLDSRVRAVVAIAPYDRVSTPISARLMLRALPSWLLTAPALLLLRLLGVRNRSLVKQTRTLQVPLTVISADGDRVAPAADGRAIAAAAPDGLGRFVSFASADHADPGAVERLRFETLLREAVTSGRASSGAAG